MSTLDTIVKDYDKNIVLRDCQRQAFEYLHDKKGDLLVTTFGTTFDVYRDREPARTDNSVWEVGEKEVNIVKGARFCYCRIYHKFVNFIILNLFKVVK